MASSGRRDARRLYWKIIGGAAYACAFDKGERNGEMVWVFLAGSTVLGIITGFVLFSQGTLALLVRWAYWGDAIIASGVSAIGFDFAWASW
jgi:hypothetical protein